MCKNCSKIKAYLGFALRARKVIYGVDDIIRLIKCCQVIIISNSLAKSSFDKLTKIAEKNHIKVYVLEAEVFVKNIENENIKAMAITDKNLSDAIKKELD